MNDLLSKLKQQAELLQCGYYGELFSLAVAEIERLRDTNRRLLEAARPFAPMWGYFVEEFGRREDLKVNQYDPRSAKSGDLRRLAAVVKELDHS